MKHSTALFMELFSRNCFSWNFRKWQAFPNPEFVRFNQHPHWTVAGATSRRRRRDDEKIDVEQCSG
jgi:hypothetical protein